jgi:hypothetical protein
MRLPSGSLKPTSPGNAAKRQSAIGNRQSAIVNGHPRSSFITTQPNKVQFNVTKFSGQEGRFTPAQVPSPLNPTRYCSMSQSFQVRKGGSPPLIIIKLNHKKIIQSGKDAVWKGGLPLPHHRLSIHYMIEIRFPLFSSTLHS